MEFHSLKRRDLQILCKKNNIPANTTNAAMADALASLDIVEGIEEFLGQTEVKDVSPERSVITSPNMTRTSTRQRVRIEESECSKLATRTRCSTRRNAVAGTDAKQTPATRTSRRTARKIQHNIEAEYEASLEESEVSEIKELSNECESVEESKQQDDNASSENQIESQGQAYDQEEVESEAQDVSSGDLLNVNLKVDLHSFSRKQLQNLCKRNKIPANITNAAMIDALEALESVEGLEDFLKESDPLAVKSPETSRMTSSQARQSRIAQKTTCLKPAQARSAVGKISAQKKDDSVVQSLTEKMDSTMEDIDCSVSISTAEDVLSKEVDNDEQNHLEPLPEKLDVLDCVFENDKGFGTESKALSESSLDGSEASVVETPEELLDDVAYESSNPTNIISCDDALENTGQEDALEIDGDDQNSEANEPVEFAAVNESLESNTLLLNHPNSDEGESQLLSDEVSDESDTSLMMDNIKEFQDDVIENEVEGKNDSFETEVHDSSIELALNPVADSKISDVLAQEEIILSEAIVEKPIVNEGLMPEASQGAEGFEVSDNSIVNDIQEDEIIFQDDDARGDDMKILSQLGDRVDEIDGIGDMGTADSNVVEVVGDMENAEGSKSISNSATEDEDLSFDSDSVQYSMKKQESSCLEINIDKESESCQEKVDELIMASNAAANECEVKKPEGSFTDDQMTKKFFSELTTKATEHDPKAKGTPLNHKSLRKLKKMLKEKLQTTTLLSSKMEKLTLEEVDVEPIEEECQNGEVEPVQEECQNLKEECEKTETTCVLSTIVSASVPAAITGNDDLDEVSTQSVVDKAVNDSFVNAATQIPLSNSTLKLEGNDESENQTTELVIPLQEVGNESETSLQFTPSKSLRKTAIKSSSKTTMSAGRKNHDALDMITNKENIDKSASKTGPGKTEMAVFGSGKLLSPISMRKLKKELQQQSEKRRTALQSRSENQCPLSSP